MSMPSFEIYMSSLDEMNMPSLDDISMPPLDVEMNMSSLA